METAELTIHAPTWADSPAELRAQFRQALLNAIVVAQLDGHIDHGVAEEFQKVLVPTEVRQ